MNNLKPCPFCGGTALTVYDSRSGSYIICDTCNMYGPTGRGDEVEKVWNKRAVVIEPPSIKCEITDCTNEAVYEAWLRRRDPFLGTPSGHLIKITICEEHKTHPWLCANEPKPVKEGS